MTRLQLSLACMVLALFTRDAGACAVDYSAKEITCKVVYYGPPTASLRDNVAYIYAKTNPDAKGKMVAQHADQKDVEFYDFLPIRLGDIRGFKVHFHLYTTPKKPEYNDSRMLILKGVNGVVFVADSDPAQLTATLASWSSLKGNLTQLGYDWKQLPLVIELDHHDQPNAMSIDAIKQALGLTDQPTLEAAPKTGVGVFDTLKAIAKKTLMELRREGAK